MAIRADVTAPDDVAAMFEDTNRRWGRVDVLVHNALIPYDVTSFADLSWEQLGGKLERELHAAFLVTKAVVPGMISRSYGRLVYLSTGVVPPAPRRHDHAGHRQGGDGPVRPLRRTRAGAARDHRQSGRRRRRWHDTTDAQLMPGRVASTGRDQPDGAPGPSRRSRQDGGFLGE